MTAATPSDLFEVILLDDLGYVQQSPEEAEVLFTLLGSVARRRFGAPSCLVAIIQSDVLARLHATGTAAFTVSLFGSARPVGSGPGIPDFRLAIVEAAMDETRDIDETEPEVICAVVSASHRGPP